MYAHGLAFNIEDDLLDDESYSLQVPPIDQDWRKAYWLKGTVHSQTLFDSSYLCCQLDIGHHGGLSGNGGTRFAIKGSWRCVRVLSDIAVADWICHKRHVLGVAVGLDNEDQVSEDTEEVQRHEDHFRDMARQIGDILRL
ncbi:MAG: hypothetical protein J3R72DRAFT_418110 [Linnemannia gamsii]|nr:MAG: hypothetical protein J3R72DRAFT_418110 [Linnemannia gamsii]